MQKKQKTGKLGENLAQKYLQDNGYVIVAKNWRYKKAEIDIIALIKNTLVFVEVKTRNSITHGYPETFVSINQERKITEAATAYIHENGKFDNFRFDIISITISSTEQPIIEHFKDVFF